MAGRKRARLVGTSQPKPTSRVVAEVVKVVETPLSSPEPKPTPTVVAQEVKVAAEVTKAPRLAIPKMRVACPRCGPMQVDIVEKRISFCPNCGSYLTPIVGHRNASTASVVSKERSTVPEFRSDGTQIGNLASFLSRHGFYVALHAKQYLAGRHASGNTIFVKVMQMALLDSSDWLTGFHFAVDSFKRLIEGLDKIWSTQTKAFVSGLNLEVLTPFGWHASLDEPSRQAALGRCAAGLGIDHVLNVLRWLRNSWQNHPTHYVHSEAVKRDYLWFDRNFGEEAYPTHRKRRELRTKIESECQHVIAESPSFRKVLGSRSADRFLIVVI